MRIREGKWSSLWRRTEKLRVTLPPHRPEIVRSTCASLFVSRLMLRQSHSLFEEHQPKRTAKSIYIKNTHSDVEQNRGAAFGGIWNLSDMHGLLLLWGIDRMPVEAYHLWHHQPLCCNLKCRWNTTELCCELLYTEQRISKPHFSFLFLFSAGFAQGHDTFLRGFGSTGLIIPSII